METVAYIVLEIGAFVGAFFVARGTSFTLDASGNPVLRLSGIVIRVGVFLLTWFLLGALGVGLIEFTKLVL